MNLGIAAIVGIANATAAQPILHVDHDAPPGGNGLTWSTAYRHLQDALDAARISGADEIRVAQGTYRPDQGSTRTPGDRHATFEPVNIDRKSVV